MKCSATNLCNKNGIKKNLKRADGSFEKEVRKQLVMDVLRKNTEATIYSNES